MKTITVDYGLEKPQGILRRFLRFTVRGFLVLLIISLSTFIALRLWLSRSSSAKGEPPAGYSSMNQIYLAILTGALPLIDRQPSVPPELKLDEGVTYSSSGDMDLKLDLYRPLSARRDQRRPLFVLIHGGGWKSGQRGDYRPHALRVASAGYVVASLSYRLSGVAKFPAAVRDVNSALQFLANHADEYGIDPNRIVLMGGSAGGHLAMLAGYSKDPMFLPESIGSPGVRYKISAIFNFYGPCDLTSDFARNVDVVRGFLGAEYQANTEIYKKASPLFDISPDDPATLIVHGTLDDIVPVDQSDQLAAKLKEASIPFRYERINGWPHTMDLAEPMFEYLSHVILDELRQTVGRADDPAN
ncbi:MAG: alpha/beta fold hydrolase [bacterium]